MSAHAERAAGDGFHHFAGVFSPPGLLAACVPVSACQAACSPGRCSPGFLGSADARYPVPGMSGCLARISAAGHAPPQTTVPLRLLVSALRRPVATANCRPISALLPFQPRSSGFQFRCRTCSQDSGCASRQVLSALWPSSKVAIQSAQGDRHRRCVAVPILPGALLQRIGVLR